MSGESGGYAGRAATGVAWMTAQKWCGRLLGLVTIALLARLLDPADFGLVAIAMSVVAFVYLLADLGFTAYLVQAEAPTSESFSTAFWFSAAAGGVLGLLLGLIGGPLEALLGAPGVAAIMWGLVPAVLVTAVGSVPLALLRRRLRFRALALQSFAAGAVGQLVAIGAALAGLGVGALVLQVVVTQLLVTACAWANARWWPSLVFSMSDFRSMLRFGVTVVSVEVVALSRMWAENAIVVTALGVSGLGYLNIAQRLIQVAQDLTASAITPVTMVVFAQIRASRERLRAAYLRAQGDIYAVVIPVMALILAGAPLLVPLMFGGQWQASIAPSQALAIAGVLTVGASLDMGLMYGLGRPVRWLVYAIVIDGLTVIATWVLAPFGLLAIALGFIGVALLATAARWPMVAYAIGGRSTALAAQFLRAVAVGLAVGAVAWGIRWVAVDLAPLLVLAFCVLGVGIVWVVSMRLLLPSSLRDLASMGRRFLGRGRSDGSRHAPSARALRRETADG